jgi:hypothetical protein
MRDVDAILSDGLKSPQFGVGVDGVRFGGDAVDDYCGEPWVGKHLRRLAEREAYRAGQACVVVALGDDLKDGSARRRGAGDTQVRRARQVRWGVAVDDASELAA